ncbi:MAG TPA: condensation domain-containing protein, partial [Herpetosiphonaceae bacterium]
TPIQHHFLAQALPNPHHFNQAMLLDAGEPLDPSALEAALQAVLRHHDALRLRLEATTTGWRQYQAAPDETPLLTTIDLRAVPLAEQPQALAEAASAVQRSLHLAHGPLLRAALVQRGHAQPDRLLLVGHHLAVDAVSWSVLLADLETAYRQLAQAQPLALPPKTTAFQQWAARLVAYATSPTLLAELPSWLRVVQRALPPLPVDFPGGANTFASTRNLMIQLEAAQTASLLHEVPQAYQTQIIDVLLTALAQTLTRWSGNAVRVALEGHGREDLFAEVDLARTVGWFTALYPVLLETDGRAGLGEQLKAIKEQLRQIPQRGIGYGLLRYLNQSQETAPLRDHAPVEVNFNYLGQIDQGVPQKGLFTPVREPIGPEQDPEGQRAHLIEITCFISGGQLLVGWTFSTAIHEQATIERLTQDYMASLRALIAHCLSPDSGGFTPSDFAEYQWDQTDLDDITAAISKSLGVA